MADWLNHAAIAAPRNGTTSHTVTPSSGTVVAGAAFTPTAGRFLLVCVNGAVTSTTPTSWTLPTNGSAINNTGLYVWYRASAAGSDSITTTHNGSNFPAVFDFYEFPAGSTFSGAATAINVSNNGGAGPTLSGLTGTNWTAGAVGQDNNSTTLTGTTTWSAGAKLTDTSVPLATTNGYTYSLTATDGNTATTASYAATVTGVSGTSVERLVFAVKVAAGTAPSRVRRVGKRR